MEVYDYTDPVCPFCTEQYQKEPPVRAIPIDRVLSKLDELLDCDNSAEAKRMLLYWLSEARLGKDGRGEITVLNELMGLCRTTGDRDNAFKYAEEGIALAKKDHWQSITGATVALNAATVCKAFGEPKRAMELYRHAQKIYEQYLSDDYRLGSLYNNMALALAELGEYVEAEELYNKALCIMEKLPNREPEQAVTYLNIADLVTARDGAENAESRVNDCLDKAEELLEKAEIRDGKYAFVCEKCASVFGYYGRFAYEQILNERVNEIYERT